MRPARLLVLLSAVVLVAAGAGSARSDTAAPTGLHGFLLRADEPQKTSFSRTPSFAWNPVPGALHYEFQLSLSTTFRDNAIIYADAAATTPVEAPTITLPWITGSPHALFARVRAITPDGATPWSDSFGFDMVPPPPPTPLAGYPGLLRWTPVEGASSYQVWLVDAHKMESTTTNSLDEREFYTFHPTTGWTGTVRWRIRAMRADATIGTSRLNSIPAVTYGQWSPIYTSTNPSTSGGPITLVGTVSDVFSDGSPGSPAHKLMPAFLWKGNQTLDGTAVELYRIYVFTDSECLNRVFTSAVIGSPAYSPRPMGPLQLPNTPAGIAAARTVYLGDGSEPPSYTYDGDQVTSSESQAQATPTTSVPAEPGDTGSATPSASSTPSTPSSSSTTTPSTPTSTGAAPGTISVSGNLGAPVDLWDTDWPSSGYYWTVVGVAALAPNSLATNVAGAGAKTGDTALPVANGAGFSAGDVISVGTGATAETATITAVSANSLTLAAALKYGHGGGELVVRTSGNLVYQDLELPQDVCASGRVMRFGKASEPSLTSSGELFATGLSSDGRLTSAVHTTSFYGQPLVSWTPALGADAYEVQWSKTKYPFVPEATSTGGLGFMTTGTSAVLPVGAGIWYYRVRGFDFSLPSGAQQMSWSDPSQLTVAQPQFKVIVGANAPAPAKKPAAKGSAAPGLRTVTGTGFSIGVPSGWTKRTVADSLATFMYLNPSTRTNLVVLSQSGRGGRTMAQWQGDLVNEFAAALGVTPSAALVTLPAGPAVRLTVTRSAGGVRITQVQYVVDAGPLAYTVTFTTTAARYATDSAAFARMIASFKLTS